MILLALLLLLTAMAPLVPAIPLDTRSEYTDSTNYGKPYQDAAGQQNMAKFIGFSCLGLILAAGLGVVIWAIIRAQRHKKEKYGSRALEQRVREAAVAKIMADARVDQRSHGTPVQASILDARRSDRDVAAGRSAVGGVRDNGHPVAMAPPSIFGAAREISNSRVPVGSKKAKSKAPVCDGGVAGGGEPTIAREPVGGSGPTGARGDAVEEDPRDRDSVLHYYL